MQAGSLLIGRFGCLTNVNGPTHLFNILPISLVNRCEDKVLAEILASEIQGPGREDVCCVTA